MERISLRSLLDGDADAAAAVRASMRSRSFVILNNDTGDGATGRAEAAALQLFERAAGNEGVKQVLLEAAEATGLRELGFASTTAKFTFNYKHGPACPPTLWPSEEESRQHSTLANCFDFLERVCVASYSVLQYDGDLEACAAFLNSHGALGVPASGVSSSLLQCFYYANTHSLDQNPNCGEHVDQGFLSIEPATKVPGLQVYDFAAASWLDVDVALAPTDLVLFCAESLQRFSRSEYKGTVHRVGKDAQHRPRLSMVYKMRHRAIEEFEAASQQQFVHYHDGLGGGGGHGGGDSAEEIVRQQVLGMGFSVAQVEAAIAAVGYEGGADAVVEFLLGQ